MSRLREPINGLTHLAGAVLALAGSSWLVYVAATRATAWHMVGFSVFGASLILLYLASGIYHSLSVSARAHEFLQRLDHIMIYILIAGTYTPVCLVPLRGGWGWSLFGAIWGLAGAGIALELTRIRYPRWLTVIIYLIMGWLCLVAVVPLVRTMTAGGLGWLALGGIFYSVGALIYGLKRPNLVPGIFGHHELWHLFVMAGSFCHYWVMLKYL